MTTVSFDYRAFPRKINIGCGLDRREGFLNVDLNDFHHPDLVADAAELSMLPDGYYEYILALDVLEHIPRVRIRTALREWNRLLEEGGRLELQVPNVMGLFKLLEQPENRSIERQEELLQCLFGTQTYDGAVHYFGFTEIVLTHFLHESGFKIVKMQEKDEWMFWVLARKTLHRAPDDLLKIDDPHRFLEEAYWTLLDREPDPEGLSFYLARLEEGVGREAIIEALKGSQEYRQRQEIQGRKME